ncbi:MAG: efflux RND transporter periplasmic adaptor subunit [Halioglobus sp.]
MPSRGTMYAVPQPASATSDFPLYWFIRSQLRGWRCSGITARKLRPFLFTKRNATSKPTPAKPIKLYTPIYSHLNGRPIVKPTLKNFVLPLLFLALAAGVAYLMIASRDDIPRRSASPTPAVVEVLQAKPGPVPISVRSRGIVRPQYSIDLVSEVSGKVIWVDPGFLAGEPVSAGQLLLRIDPIDYEVALSDAQSAVATAELALAEVKVIVKKAAIEEAEAALTAAKSRLAQAQADLANTEIRAPFNAIVDSKQIDLGQYVQTGMSMMRLLSTDLAEIRLPILGSDVPFINLAADNDEQRPEAILSMELGSEAHTWRADLARLEQRVDEQTRVFYVVAQVREPYNTDLHARALTLGLFVEAQLEGRVIDNAVSVPTTALHNGKFVYVVRDGALLRKQAKLLRRESDSVILDGEGLAGKAIVLNRLDLMIEGMAVRINE